MLKLNLGSGNVCLPGFLNLDCCDGADLKMDITKGLYQWSFSVDYVYSEHFIEHVTFDQAAYIIKECHRVLRKGGVLRISTPDLDRLVEKYQNDWKNQLWLGHDDYQFIETRGMMINHSFRGWGHQYLFNEEDLRRLMEKVGFTNVKRCETGRSEHEELRGVESREEVSLILEGIK
jgi:predicted SAM-dependent methyltransferase